MSGSGERLGRYVIDRELGRGGMGVIYAATDPELGRRVAIKQLRATGSLRHPAVLARFERPDGALRGEGVRQGGYRAVTDLAVSPEGDRLYAVRVHALTGEAELTAVALPLARDATPSWRVAFARERSDPTPRLALSADGRRLLVAAGDRLEVWCTPP